MTVAVQRIGSFFNSENDICLSMYYLRGDEFKSRLTAVLFSILATPLSAIEVRESYKQTRQILQAHVYGLDMLSAVGRAKLHRNGDIFITDWRDVDPFSEGHMREWSTAMIFIASDLR